MKVNIDYEWIAKGIIIANCRAAEKALEGMK